MPALRLSAAKGAVALLGASAALAAVPSAIFTNVASLPNSDVPGGAGLKFNTFDRPVRSPNGQHWMLLSRNTNATSSDAMYLTGSGAGGILRVQEGVTEIETGRVPENMSERRVGINDSGDYAFTVNLTGATTDDQVAVKGSGGVHSIAFREGNAVPSIGGASYGSSMADVNFTNGGAIGLRVASLVGPSSTTNAAWLLNDGATLAAQRGVTSPTGGATGDTYSDMNFGSLWVDATGSNWLGRGTLNGPAATNSALVVNNAVQIQKGINLLGFGSAVSAIITQNMTSNGDWFARGENADDQAWVVRNGAVLADSDDAVPGGEAGENFSNAVWNVNAGNTFFMHTGNNVGDYIYGGFTDLGDPDRNAVWVLNNSQVVLRNGDQVDIDGDGVLDDAFIKLTGLTGTSLDNKVDGAFLTDDLWLYFTADLVNAGGVDLGEAFLRVQVPEPATLSLLLVLAPLAARRR